MPVHYKPGILEEHRAVRNSVGVFDVSHMGQIFVVGREACEKLQGLYTNDIRGLAIGKAVYTHVLREDGTIIDDTIVYRLAKHSYLAIPNASMIETIHRWMVRHTPEGVINLSDKLACLAVQGPLSDETMKRIFGKSIDDMNRFSFMFYDLDGQLNYNIHANEDKKTSTDHPEIIEEITTSKSMIVARTGYTGENGYELILHNDHALALWNKILNVGNQQEAQTDYDPSNPRTEIDPQTPSPLPIGLGARDTLRLEMGYLLSGEDFDGRQTPLECASSWVVKWDHDFIGKEALLKQKKSKNHDLLVGIRLEKRLAARHGAFVYPVITTESHTASGFATGAHDESPVETKGSPSLVADEGKSPISPTSGQSAQHQQVTSGSRSPEPIGTVTSGGFAPTVGTAIALARVKRSFAKAGTPLEIEVKGRRLRGTVEKLPFIKK